MNTASNATTTNAALSEDVDSRITFLQSEISNLNDEANRWNGRYIRSLTAALFIGLWTLVCQFSAIQKSRLLSDKQSELLHVKDIKAANDSRDKDARIGEANKIAGAANERAGTANKLAGDANERASRFEAEAEKSRADIARANENAAVASSRAAEATKAAEQEKLERLKLEAVIAPRRLDTSQKLFITEAARQFAGKKVIVTSYALDSEALVLGSQIVDCLRNAGVDVTPNLASMIPAGGFVIGIHVSGWDADSVNGLGVILLRVGHLESIRPTVTKRPELPQGQQPTDDSQIFGANILVGVKPVKQ